VPRITSVEPQKKRTNRFNIYLDGKFGFGIDAEMLLTNNIKIGQTLTQEKISSIISQEESAKLTDKVLNFLSYRPRSQREIIDYLTKKIKSSQNISYKEAHDSQIIKNIINKLEKYKYIDDLEFAKWWVLSRTRSRPKGPLVIKRELIAKGIDDTIIESVLSTYKNQTEIAKELIAKKIKNWQSLSYVQIKNKVYSYLANRGFEFDTIKEVIANFVKKR